MVIQILTFFLLFGILFSKKRLFEGFFYMSSPTVRTDSPSEIFATYFTANANLLDIGGKPILWYGFSFLVGSSGDPRVDSDFVVQHEGPRDTGPFSFLIAGLTGGQTYRIAAWARNEDGISYGETLTVTTFVDLRVQWNERLIGAEHPTLADTLNRLFLVEHNIDGTHKH